MKARRTDGEEFILGTERGHGRPLVKVQPHLYFTAQNSMDHAKNLMLGTMKRAYEKLLVKPSNIERPQSIGGASTMG